MVTDSACSLPPELADASGVTVVPMWVTSGDRQWRDGDVSAQDLTGVRGRAVTTSCPSPGELVEAFGLAPGSAVLVLTVSRRMSAMFDAASVAARLVEGREVRVIDTGTAAGAQGLVALAAAQAAAAGGSLAEVEAVSRRVAGRVRLVATLPSLSTLARSGRVPNAAAWAGTWLGLHPLFEFRAGRVSPARPAFSRRAALDRLVAALRQEAALHAGHELHICALHALEPDLALELLHRAHEVVEPASSFVGAFSAVMLAHTGPGLAGLSWWWREDGQP